MKSCHALILLSLFTSCAARKEVRSLQPRHVLGTTVAAEDMPEIRTPETVKAYPVGRYTDPNFPDEMHERHTLYRREQSAGWNYHPSQPHALPLGPVVAVSDPSPSYYAKTNAEQINAQQKAYAEALLEQNRAMKERIDALQKNESTIQSLQSEVERLKKELDSRRKSPPVEDDRADTSNDFSFWRATPNRAEDEISDPGEIVLFLRSEADCQAFLVSQMRLNDELAKALDALERHRLLNLLGRFSHPAPTSRSSPTTHHEPTETQPSRGRRSAHHQGRKRRAEVRFRLLAPSTISPISLRQNPSQRKPASLMSKSTTVTVSLDEHAYGVFQMASEIVSKAGIRVPTGQLVQTMINAEMSRLSAREIAQRFLKSIMKQVGVLSGQNPDDDEDNTIPTISAPKAE
jgi:hypothetical protein